MFFTTRVATDRNIHPAPIETTEIIGFNTEQLIHISKITDSNSIKFILSDKYYTKSFSEIDDMDDYFNYLVDKLGALGLSTISNKLQKQDSQFIRVKWHDRNKKIREEIINKDKITEIEKYYTTTKEYVVFIKWAPNDSETNSVRRCDVNFTNESDANDYFDYVMEKLCYVKFKE